MPNIAIRAISGAIYVILIVGLLLLSPTMGFRYLMIVFAILAAMEYTAMSRPSRVWLRVLDVIAIVAPVFFTSRIPGFSVSMVYVMAGCSFYGMLRLLLELFTKDEKPLEEAAKAAMGILYIGMPLMLVSMCGIAPDVLLLGFIMIWMNDTGAYLVGRSFGKTKLFERISPKKTVEGAIGGAIASILTGVAAAIYISGIHNIQSVEVISCAIMGLLICIASTVGDLVESMIKREEGIKDSGKIIPGHGGILDRIDSLIYCAPVIAIIIAMAE